jgi:hypothetical protein
MVNVIVKIEKVLHNLNELNIQLYNIIKISKKWLNNLTSIY